ncbi:hypothetical protein JD844_002392, partial [Phrynosoma platyrhinos]
LIFGTLYPAYYSYKAVKSKDIKEYRHRTDSESEGRRSPPPSEPVGDRSTDAWLTKFPELIFDRQSGSYLLKVQPKYLGQLHSRPSSASRRRDQTSMSLSPPRYRASKRRHSPSPSPACSGSKPRDRLAVTRCRHSSPSPNTIISNWWSSETPFVISSPFPFYYELKIAFVAWLLSPYTKGSSLLYRKFVHPTLSSKEKEIDDCLVQAKDRSYDALVHFGKRGLNVAATAAVMAASKVTSTTMQDMMVTLTSQLNVVHN